MILNSFTNDNRKIDDKYEYLTGEEILPPDQVKVIEQAKFSYSSLGIALKNKQNQSNTKRKINWSLNVLKPDAQQLSIKNEIQEDEEKKKYNEVKDNVKINKDENEGKIKME